MCFYNMLAFLLVGYMKSSAAKCDCDDVMIETKIIILYSLVKSVWYKKKHTRSTTKKTRHCLENHKVSIIYDNSQYTNIFISFTISGFNF